MHPDAGHPMLRFFPLLFAAATAAPSSAAVPPAAPPSLSYAIDLNDRADDLFKVTLTVEGLGAGNAIYQFASTAPGTYQVMDIGRFVRRFEALDAAGAKLPVKQVSVNQWH